MSYSRWGATNWYIYHSASSGETKDEQVLAIWYVGDDELPHYSYTQLRDDREGVWDDISRRVQPDEREVFDECVDEFLADIENKEWP